MRNWRAQKTRHVAGFSVFLVAGAGFGTLPVVLNTDSVFDMTQRNVNTFTFTGVYEKRSSKPSGNRPAKDPAGEAKLLELNPDRVERLLGVTGWSAVVGSLNLTVKASVVERLGRLCHLYFEDPSLIEYPEGEPNVAEWRGGYLYYRAVIATSNYEKEVLVRRAKELPLEGRIEVYSEERLEGLKTGGCVIVTVREPC